MMLPGLQFVILKDERIIMKRSLGVSHANWAVPISSYGSRAFASIGIPTIQDFSSGKLLGAQYTPLTVSSPNEERSSSESSFLRAAKGRKNLKVYSRTLAKRILFDDNKKATGVLAQAASETIRLTAKREIILSAGAVGVHKETWDSDADIQQFQSPQLLMISGIGPLSTLKKIQDPDRDDTRRRWSEHVGPTIGGDHSASDCRNTKRAF